MTNKPLIVITEGEAGGVGPELVVRAFGDPAIRQRADLVVVGNAKVLRAAAGLSNAALNVETVGKIDEAKGVPDNILSVLDLGLITPETLAKGKADPRAGEASVVAIHHASDLVASGAADAVVSAPANKVSMNAAGHVYPGQTEIFLERWNVPRDDAHIMLLGAALRVSLVTGHCSMRDAVDRIKQDLIERIGRQCGWTLKHMFGLDAPLIGVAGLNCHAGDGGLFGPEEIEEISPALATLRGEGMRFSDPLPPDTLFYQAELGAYDGVLGMYHDQGAIPLKREGYVTLIAGVPHIRTTCGHGTAYDIAWQNKVDPRLFLRALTTAVDLVEARRGH